MSEMKQKEPSQPTGSANNTTPSTAAQNPKAAKAKVKKGKEGGQNTLVPSGAQVIDPASSSAPTKQKKRNDEAPVPAKRQGGGQNTIEYRLDYVVS